MISRKNSFVDHLEKNFDRGIENSHVYDLERKIFYESFGKKKMMRHFTLIGEYKKPDRFHPAMFDWQLQLLLHLQTVAPAGQVQQQFSDSILI